MFKTKIKLVDENWTLIHEYKSNVKPLVDEFIYLEPKYLKVMAVIHTIKLIGNSKFLTVVVKEWNNISKI
jgi:hypothetical protein